MAITDVATLAGGFGSNTGSVSSISGVLIDYAPNAGDFLVLVIGARNIVETGDAATNEVYAVNDTWGQWQWQKVYEYCNGNGSALAGVLTSIWIGRATTAGPGAGDNYINISFVSPYTAAAIARYRLFNGSGNTYLLEASASRNTSAADASTAPSLAISGLTSREYLFLRADVSKTDSLENLSASTNYTDGGLYIVSSTDPVRELCLNWEFRILTGTASTSAPGSSTTKDRVGLHVAIYEATNLYINPFMFAPRF